MDADLRGGVAEVENFGRRSESAFGRSEQSLDRLGNRLTSVGAGMITFGTIAAVGLVQAGQAASDLNEVASKSATVFGAASGKVAEFAESAADIGLSERAALEAASGFGNLFTQVGLASGRAADMSVQMTELAADFASFHNADITEVIQAQEAAFRGEYDAVQRFVPTINAAAVETRALAESGKESAAQLTAGEKAIATYGLMLDGAGKALGDFDRTSDSAANQQRQLSAEFENLKAQIGQGALPVMNQLLGVAVSLAGGFGELDESTGGLLGQVATFGTIGLIALGGLSMLGGQVIKARDTIKSMATTLDNLPRSATLAAKGLAAVAVAGAGLEIFGQLRMDRVADELEGLVEGVDTSKITGVRDALATMREELDRLDDREGAGRLFSFEPLGLDAFATTGDADRNERIGQLRDQIADLEDKESSLEDQERQLAESFVGTSDALAGANQETVEAINLASEHADATRAMFDPLFGMFDALLGVDEATAGVAEAQANLDQVLADEASTAADVAAAQRDLSSAQIDAARAALDVEAATAELNAAVAANPALVNEAKGSLADWVAQGIITQQEADAVALHLDYLASRGVALGEVDPEIRINVLGAEISHAQIDALKREIDSIDGRVAHVSVNFRTGGVSIAEMIRFAGPRALGGPALANEMYLVGERGPELFISNQSGRIVPNNELSSVASAVRPAMLGGGGTTVIAPQIHFHGPVAQDSERWVSEMVNRGISSNRINNRGRRFQ